DRSSKGAGSIPPLSWPRCRSPGKPSSGTVARDSPEIQVGLEGVEDLSDRVGERQAQAVGAALVAAGEQERHGASVRIDDQRTAVAALAEWARIRRLDLDLAVELQGAGVVLDHHVIQLEGGDAALGCAGGPANLADLVVLGEHCVAQAGQLTQA